ncbi:MULTISPECIES: L,D-transpeptidase family protein [Shewanella]|uniref:ErfK/YbiS/YcfS/YnhG n=2 Tax=Shewanella TaxID=22 RepID=A1S7G2_SHEAM|nr:MULTISPECIES: L,D-transpeptidase family protein [Shewanella]ABM00319.1 ErfK/YbiS/YcfS/YnhG [Shewanella amazonensis SB2B]MCL2919571.1 L,D-transpeptidase family protein [Shewanella litorisediminis]QRH00393.1 L,D-transpeptidase family protein [Shewanella litorisediminis]QYK03789.1 L,D-transpeptidase family protein [Shewanella zhangzhouensis]
MFRQLLVLLLLVSASVQANAIKPGQKVDLVVVNKAEAQMQVFYRGELIKSYRIAMGDNPKGHKLKEGDQRTPQGRYLLDFKKADSAYYRSIHISYPNDEDILRAKALGISPGGAIMIHGQDPKSPLSAEEAQKYNWTNGCIAVTNRDMDELWQLIDPGTPIEIWP